MPKRKDAPRCTECGKMGPVSRTNKLCFSCGVARQVQTINQLRAKKGPIFDKWRVGILSYLEGAQENGKTKEERRA